FEEGVRVLLQIWSERSSVWKKRRFGSGLPVRIWSLTGRASREWLAEYIQKTYPDREHEKASNLPIPILKSIRGTDSWEDFLQAYKINVNKQRRKLYYSTQAKKSAAHRFRKSALNAL
ncbi:MAG: hypothetical protein KGI50_06490, partial [Patescibacteria group bacterium]|nr:hypothetical protein [Patescibacteria group bacterium]